MTADVAQQRVHSSNPLLNRPELGKTTHRGIDLPPSNFTYGMPNVGEDNGAGNALSSWSALERQALNASAVGGKSGPGGLTRSKTFAGGRDFVSMNRAATMKGLHTSNDFGKFRATHNIKKQPVYNKEAAKGPEVTRMAPETVFGLPTRACTPVFDLIEHKYQERWLQERRQTELATRSRLQQSRADTGKIYETRASLLRKYLPPIENHELWQIRKFKKVQPAVSTFRSASARQQALENQDLDGAARFGYLGQGSYTTPPY